MARAIRCLSARWERPFCGVNCAAFPANNPAKTMCVTAVDRAVLVTARPRAYLLAVLSSCLSFRRSLQDRWLCCALMGREMRSVRVEIRLALRRSLPEVPHASQA